MPFSLLLNPTVLLGIALAIAMAAVHHYRSELNVTEAQFGAFKAQVEAVGKQAEAAAKLQEVANAAKISSAMSDRDAALARLRGVQANANRSFVPNNPAAPAGSRQVCFDSKAYSAAFERFGTGLDASLRRITGVAVEGDVAQLDAVTLLKAWPSTKADPAPSR